MAGGHGGSYLQMYIDFCLTICITCTTEGWEHFIRVHLVKAILASERQLAKFSKKEECLSLLFLKIV